MLRRKQKEEPPPKLAGRKPLAFAVAAREAETGSLEPFLFRTYPREQGTAPGRSDVKLWQAVAATCAAPAVFAPVQIDGESYVDGGVVANDPTLLALAEVASVFPGTARRGRGFTRMRPDQEGAPGGAAGGAALVSEA